MVSEEEKMNVEEKSSKKSNKKVVIMALIILLVLIIAVITIFVVKRQIEYSKIQIELKESQVKLTYGETLDVNEFLSKYEGGEIQIENNIDFEKVGEYTVIYKVINSDGLEKTKEMTVNITDEVKPVITLKNDNISVEIGKEVDLLSEVTAEDNYDKDITDKIVVTGEVDTKTEGTYEVKYDVKDSSGNIAETKTRKYTVKKKATLQIGKTYEWTNSEGGSEITLKENNKVEETSWANLGGAMNYKGTYKIEGNKLTISLTHMQGFMEWEAMPSQAKKVFVYTITADNQFEDSEGRVYKIK